MEKDHAEIIQAIRGLSGLYFLTRHIPAIDIRLDEGEIAKAIRECVHAERQSRMEIEQAQQRLLKTSFSVPDKWLTVEAIGKTREERHRVHNSPDSPLECRLIRTIPSVESLESVCREMHAACLRLEVDSPKGAQTNKRKRGRPQLELKQQRADFAKEHSDLEWPEMADAYKTKHPEDREIPEDRRGAADKLRHDHSDIHGVTAAAKKRGNANK